MKQVFKLLNKLKSRILLSSLVLLSTQAAIGQFGTAAPTSTTSPAPLTVNGVYISRGFYQANSNSYSNIGIGTGTLGATTTNSYSNTAVGVNAMAASNDAVATVAFGTGALRYGTGSDNAAFGNLSLGATGNSGSQNTAGGGGSLSKNTTGSYNSAFGFGSLSNNTTGNGNVALGHIALGASSTGTYNIAIGYQSLRLLSTGDYNTTLGSQSLWSFTSGSNNTAIGRSALLYKTGGDNNSALGSGAYASSGSGSNNCAFGYNSLGISAGDFNVAIGSGANVTSGSNYQLSIQNVIYGVNMNTAAAGNVGIGIIPTATVAGAQQGLQPVGTFSKLHLGGSATMPSLRLNYVPNATVLAGRSYLFVDAAGIVTQAPLPAGSGGTTTINLYNSNGTIDASTTTSGNRVIDMNNSNIWFNTTSSATRGRLYIGASPLFATTTGNYRLFVEGGILTEKIKVAIRNPATNWADYVFEGDYKPMPLKSLESFVKVYKHLPGIEGADDLVKDGLDLGAMQAKQMGKIEELTLYIIDQNKILEKQQEEINDLKATVEILLKKSK